MLNFDIDATVPFFVEVPDEVELEGRVFTLKVNKPHLVGESDDDDGFTWYESEFANPQAFDLFVEHCVKMVRFIHKHDISIFGAEVVGSKQEWTL